MRKEETLILGREDMIETHKGKNILLIDFTDFKISVRPLKENGIILFIDNNGDTKILKNRFGDKGIGQGENAKLLAEQCALHVVSGNTTDKFGTIMTCLPKYSNCQLCKYKEEPQDSEVCTHCAKHNKCTEYYR